MMHGYLGMGPVPVTHTCPTCIRVLHGIGSYMAWTWCWTCPAVPDLIKGQNRVWN